MAHGSDAFRAMELEAVRVSLANLRTFPWVREREATGALTLHGAYFAIADGVLHLLDEASGSLTQFGPSVEGACRSSVRRDAAAGAVGEVDDEPDDMGDQEVELGRPGRLKNR